MRLHNSNLSEYVQYTIIICLCCDVENLGLERLLMIKCYSELVRSLRLFRGLQGICFGYFELQYGTFAENEAAMYYGLEYLFIMWHLIN